MREGKIAAPLAAQLTRAVPSQRLRVIVGLRDVGVRAADIMTASSLAIMTYHLIPAVAVEALPADIIAMAADERISAIWADLPVHIWLDASVPLIGAPRVWEVGYRGRGITVAVVDTGVDQTHPDLAGRVTQTKDITGEGYRDGHGHGTHVAGIIAGNGQASGGRYRGVAPEAEIMAAKVLRSDGSGLTSDVMAGIEWAVEHGAKIINLSLGAAVPCDGTDALSVMCDAAVDRGVVVCVAAGNAGPAAGTVGPPGCARKVITVGATDKSDQVTGFSSRGPTADGRTKPDVCMPGLAITSLRASGTSMGTVLNDYYTSASGTSMATPHCSGAVALLLQARPSLTPAAVKDLLMNTAKNLGVDANAQGAGRVQVYQAYVGEPAPPPAPEPGRGCAQVIPSLFLRSGRIQ